jgi:hypothetical protein
MRRIMVILLNYWDYHLLFWYQFYWLPVVMFAMLNFTHLYRCTHVWAGWGLAEPLVHKMQMGQVQGDRKVTQPIPDICSICKKINYTEIGKQKTMLYQVLEMSTAFSDACIHPSSHVWCNPVNSSCVTETVHQTRYCRFVWHKRIGKCIPNSYWQVK